jgi:hypothetical protein
LVWRIQKIASFRCEEKKKKRLRMTSKNRENRSKSNSKDSNPNPRKEERGGGLTESRRASPPPVVTARHSYLRRRLAGVTPPPCGTGARRCATAVHALGARAPTPGRLTVARPHTGECARRREGRRRRRHLLRSPRAAATRACERKGKENERTKGGLALRAARETREEKEKCARV